MAGPAEIDEMPDEAGAARRRQLGLPAAPRRLGGWGHVVFHDDFDHLPVELGAAFAGERP